MKDLYPSIDMRHATRPAQAVVLKDLRWLVRYAQHCSFDAVDDDSMIEALRLAFGASAWRVLCRSPKACFVPLLGHQELSIHSLIDYCKRLAERSFVRAPQPILLSYFVGQRRLYFDRPCRIPQDNDYDLMRVADRHENLKMRDVALVANWAHQSRSPIMPAHKWSNLVMRARQYNERERAYLSSRRHQPWHFFCSSTDWRGYQVDPITDPMGLWHEGQKHGTCLYRLRYDCTALKPSRFFKISKAGKSIATLELVWQAPEECFTGMDRVWGKWVMQDLRLSFNRLPGDSLTQCMQAFAWMYNFLAKRLRRMPPGYIQLTQQRIAYANGMPV